MVVLNANIRHLIICRITKITEFIFHRLYMPYVFRSYQTMGTLNKVNSSALISLLTCRCSASTLTSAC